MEATTTIRKMLKDGHIFVPEYQRAYSWDTELGGGKAMHVNVFLSDLEQYVSLPPGAYYFGHFLLERTTGKTADGEEAFAIVDGQQRLTTITIFLAALFAQLRSIRQLSEKEAHLEEDLVRRGHVMRFETVEHDRLFFKDFVVRSVQDRAALHHPYKGEERQRRIRGHRGLHDAKGEPAAHERENRRKDAERGARETGTAQASAERKMPGVFEW